MPAARPPRLRLVCRGVVQGVGFRPAVHRVATAMSLSGFVRNTPDGVVIEVEGDLARRFADELTAALPPLARLEAVQVSEIEALGSRGFSVLASETGQRERALVPPDAAVCGDCRQEMDDPGDRRFHYPFTTCTNCGPRFTVVRALPYDRARTTMACFPLCPQCLAEYGDPANRRFHAEPIACPACGPRLWLADASGATLAEANAALAAAQRALAGGAIVAIKGLGGFQLAALAEDAVAARLRGRKRRPAKPFAVMVRDLDAARGLVELTVADEAWMASPAGPILLAPRRGGAVIAPEVAPGLGDLGVMLPTTPLHVEIFRDAPFDALIMTSGNVSDEPIVCANRDALRRLAGIADLFVLHDRDVARRADDSVLRTTPAGAVAIRRARGMVPEPLPLPDDAPAAVVALGGYLQTAACVTSGGAAFLSQHVGDLDNEPARAYLAEVATSLEEFLQVRATVVAVDPHPDYPSTWLGLRLARERGGTLVEVQHHLAHAAATLAEHRRFPDRDAAAGALVLNGTGWGPDGTAWGGEVLAINGRLGWQRVARLAPLPLVGGEAAVREPWRVAVAALELGGAGDLLAALPLAQVVARDRLEAVAGLVRQGGWPLASGAGRLFEAASALLGVAAVNRYEGEAAARLEAVAATAPPADPWAEFRGEPPAFADASTAAGLPELPGAALLVAAARRVHAGESVAAVAAGFHATFCWLAAALVARALPPDVWTVALGGGCLVNRLLRGGLVASLAAHGRDGLLPTRLPPGDGGLAYGQAVVAAVAAARGVSPVEEGED